MRRTSALRNGRSRSSQVAKSTSWVTAGFKTLSASMCRRTSLSNIRIPGKNQARALTVTEAHVPKRREHLPDVVAMLILAGEEETNRIGGARIRPLEAKVRRQILTVGQHVEAPSVDHQGLVDGERARPDGQDEVGPGKRLFNEEVTSDPLPGRCGKRLLEPEAEGSAVACTAPS